MSQPLQTEFGLIRSILWPIHRHELRKLVPMLIMGFLICFNYSILRNTKDSLVVTASDAGAAVIPFIKLWLILPMAVIATYSFTKLSNRYSQEKVFYIVISSFLFLFGLFAFVLYPFREALQMDFLACYLEESLPHGLQGAVMMCRHWPLTGFYVVAELWASMVLAVLFWGFANEVTCIQEAPRFYGVLSIATNLAAIAAGAAGGYISYGWDYNPIIPFGSDAWEQSLDILVLIVIASGLITMIAFKWMNKHVLIGDDYVEFHDYRASDKLKPKLSLSECFSFLSNSKYLICIALIVVAYNLTINLIEVIWKDQLRAVYSSAADYNTYLYGVTMWMGVIATLVAMVMPWIMSRFGWTKMAMITPLIMLVTSVGFFGCLYFERNLEGFFLSSLGMSSIAIAVFFGGAQNCLCKAAKYSVFDMTKEMAFIPLSHDFKLKGKAAIDGVGSRFGKSGGSVIHHGLLILLTSLSACVPYLGIIVIGVIGIWIAAVRSLGIRFSQAVVDQKVEAIEQEALAAQRI